MIEMIYVDSTNIEAIGYDDGTRELHVQFLSSGLYIYHDVPRDVYEAMLIAPSKGSFLNREIRNVYHFSKQ